MSINRKDKRTLERAKKDIIFFAETFMEIKLSEAQKKFFKNTIGNRRVVLVPYRPGKITLYNIYKEWMKYRREK